MRQCFLSEAPRTHKNIRGCSNGTPCGVDMVCIQTALANVELAHRAYAVLIQAWWHKLDLTAKSDVLALQPCQWCFIEYSAGSRLAWQNFVCLLQACLCLVQFNLSAGTGHRTEGHWAEGREGQPLFGSVCKIVFIYCKFEQICLQIPTRQRLCKARSPITMPANSNTSTIMQSKKPNHRPEEVLQSLQSLYKVN